MSTRLFEIGREKLADDADWNSDTIKAMQLDLGTTDTMVKAITAASNASPIAITCTSHGFTNGDIIYQRGIGGNLAANGVFKVSGQTTNNYNLVTLKDGLNTTGSAAYTSGGVVINLNCANLGQIDGGRIGTDVTLTSPTLVAGVLDAADPTFTSTTGNVDGIVLYKSTGSAATDIPIVWIDGKMQVVVAADALISATTLWVEPLAGAVASGVTFTLSNGVLVTLGSSAVAGARSLTVTALPGACAAGHTADVPTTGAGLPFTGGGGSFTYQFDNGTFKIAKI